MAVPYGVDFPNLSPQLYAARVAPRCPATMPEDLLEPERWLELTVGARRIVRAPGAEVVVRLPATLRDFFRQRIRIEMGEGAARARVPRARWRAARRSPASARGAAPARRRGRSRASAPTSCCARRAHAVARRLLRARPALARRVAAGRHRRSAGTAREGARPRDALPVPPWRGDQVRAFHHLRHARARHDVTCCALVPRAAARGAARRRSRRSACGSRSCRSAWRVLVRRWRARSLGDRRPLQVLLYDRAARARAGGGARRREAASTSCTRSSCARRPICRARAGPPVVLDLIDALSANLARRARRERGPLAPVRRRRGARLRALRARADRACGPRARGVGRRARRARRRRARASWCRTASTSRPSRSHDGPRPPARLLFFGNLGYFPNVDAARWLATRDLPARARRACPRPSCTSSGARPARAVRALAALPGVSLAAAVPAMAPEIAAATVAVVPMRAGTGPAEQGPRGDGGRDAGRHDAAVAGGAGRARRRAPAGGRRRAGPGRGGARAAARPGARARHGARGARRWSSGATAGRTRRAAVEAAWAAAVRGPPALRTAAVALRAMRPFDIPRACTGATGGGGFAGRCWPPGTCWRPSSPTWWRSSCASRSRFPLTQGYLPAAPLRRGRRTTGPSCSPPQLARSTSSGSTRRGRVLAPARRTCAALVAAAVAPGAAPDRGLLLPAGPGLPALHLRRASPG